MHLYINFIQGICFEIIDIYKKDSIFKEKHLVKHLIEEELDGSKIKSLSEAEISPGTPSSSFEQNQEEKNINSLDELIYDKPDNSLLISTPNSASSTKSKSKTSYSKEPVKEITTPTEKIPQPPIPSPKRFRKGNEVNSSTDINNRTSPIAQLPLQPPDVHDNPNQNPFDTPSSVSNTPNFGCLPQVYLNDLPKNIDFSLKRSRADSFS